MVVGRSAAARRRASASLAVTPGVIVLAQALWLRPRLAARTQQVVQGGVPPPPSALHLTYVTCEVAKLGALLGLGLMAAGPQPTRHRRSA